MSECRTWTSATTSLTDMLPPPSPSPSHLHGMSTYHLQRKCSVEPDLVTSRETKSIHQTMSLDLLVHIISRIRSPLVMNFSLDTYVSVLWGYSALSRHNSGTKRVQGNLSPFVGLHFFNLYPAVVDDNCLCMGRRSFRQYNVTIQLMQKSAHRFGSVIRAPSRSPL